MKPQTIVIDNFTGALTRQRYGNMNSGLALYHGDARSFGYNPFYEPGALTWLPAATDITASLNGMLLAGKTRVESGVLFLYGITNTGHLVKINTSTDGITDLATLSTGTPTFVYGASLEFYNGVIWISNDKGLSRINFDGTSETQVGTWNSSNFIQNTYHPLTSFQGKLYVGNTTDGTTTNIGEIDTTNLIVRQNRLAPALPVGTYIRDMDVAPDFSYLVISASEVPTPALTAGGDTVSSFAADSALYKWNGSDEGVTAGQALPNFGVTALNFFGEALFTFMYDFLGVSLFDGGRKVVALPGDKAPTPNATFANGNYIVWGGGRADTSIYFYGNWDDQFPTGLWRMLNIDTDSFFTNSIPFMSFVKNEFFGVDSNGAFTTTPNKLYFSEQLVASGTGALSSKLWKFSIPGSSDTLSGFSSFVEGVYETQKQIFPQKVVVKQIRVYIEDPGPTSAFNLTLTGDAAASLGGFEYTYAAGSDPTILQGDLTRIDYNPPEGVPTFSLGLQFLNPGATKNITVKKVELDIAPAGK